MPDEAAELQPGYAPLNGLTIAPDGATNYDFDGHISARGLDIEAGDSASAPSDRRVRWIDGLPNGAVVADLLGHKVAGGHGALNAAAVGLNGSRADLSLSSGVNPGASVQLRNADNSIAHATILDGRNRSGFWQLTEDDPREGRIQFGVAPLFFPTSATSQVLIVPHDLPTTPAVAVGAQLSSSGIAAALVVAVFGATPTQFQMQAITRNGAVIGPGAVDVFWIAAAAVF